MKTSSNGIALISHYEGCKLNAYICPAGVITIGFGSTLINGNPIKMGTTITLDQAKQYLQSDLIKFESDINSLLIPKINQNQFDSVVSLSYNIGSGNFRKSTLLKCLMRGDFTGAAEQFDVWRMGGGKILPGLEKRRAAEKHLFLTGQLVFY